MRDQVWVLYVVLVRVRGAEQRWVHGKMGKQTQQVNARQQRGWVGARRWVYGQRRRLLLLLDNVQRFGKTVPFGTWIPIDPPIISFFPYRGFFPLLPHRHICACSTLTAVLSLSFLLSRLFNAGGLNVAVDHELASQFVFTGLFLQQPRVTCLMRSIPCLQSTVTLLPQCLFLLLAIIVFVIRPFLSSSLPFSTTNN